MWGRDRQPGRPALGRRLLKRGAYGGDVALLQQELRRRGYHPGPIDGRFGLLTEDAVRQLQADYALRQDGKAGPEVYGVLTAPRPVPPRRPAPAPAGVPPSGWPPSGEPRSGGARAGASPHWLLLGIPAEAGPGAGAQRVVQQFGPQLTGVVDGRPSFDGEAAPSAPPWPAGTVGWVDLPFDLTRLARRRFERQPRSALSEEPLVAAAFRWAAANGPVPVRGLHVVRPALPWGRGEAWARGFVVLSELLWRQNLTLLATLPLPDVRRPLVRAFNDLHLHRWVPFAEAVIVPAPALGEPARGLRGPAPGLRTPAPFAPWYARLEAVRAVLPLWKVLAGLDMRAVERDGKGRLLRRLPHQQALALAYRHRIRPAWDEGTGCNRLTYGEDGKHRHLYLWSRKALAAWLERIQLYGLAGVCLGPAGAEDGRLWPHALRQLVPLRYAGPVPGINSSEAEGGQGYEHPVGPEGVPVGEPGGGKRP